jgi:formylmethanofuran dehydrogenase subunit E
VNPRRAYCIYCFADLPGPRDTVVAEAPGDVPRVACALCGALVEETDTLFTEDGLICDRCRESRE